jgi:hypothetical protein
VPLADSTHHFSPNWLSKPHTPAAVGVGGEVNFLWRLGAYRASSRRTWRTTLKVDDP